MLFRSVFDDVLRNLGKMLRDAEYLPYKLVAGSIWYINTEFDEYEIYTLHTDMLFSDIGDLHNAVNDYIRAVRELVDCIESVKKYKDDLGRLNFRKTIRG